ncbi:MAG TPA: leucyl/phenylalanyl-tRNA--protein transferase, partial [Candidatus Methylacidiphilales bacterium]
AGESMFHRVPDASKLALCALAAHLREAGFALFDTQVATPVTRAFGAVDIPRSDYLRRLDRALALPAVF